MPPNGSSNGTGTAPFVPIPALDPPRDDPAAQPPASHALDPSATRIAAAVINREVPNTTAIGRWNWPGVRAALHDLEIGQFDRPAQLCESVLGDDRVQATIGSRTGGLLGRPVQFAPSRVRRVRGSDAARECEDAWRECWPTIANEAALGELHQWGIMLCSAPGQLLWDTSGDVAVPHIRPWHPRYTQYQVNWRTLLATTLDGLAVVTPGDGHWICHAPHGMHRGWMRGAIRALAQPWIQRALTYRDMARFCERHGFPIAKIMTPAAGDPLQVRKLQSAATQLGQESVLICPQGVDGTNGYDLKWESFGDTTWEVFIEAIKLCDAAITLTMLGQNLTTEVKEGSFAAARVHGDVRQAFIEFDARALSATINQQIARPFAAINFGDADLAPTTAWEITPYEDNQAAAQTLQALAQAMSALRLAGHKVTDPHALAHAFDIRLDLGKIVPVEPTQIGAAKVFAGEDAGAAKAAEPRYRIAADAAIARLRVKYGHNDDAEALLEAAYEEAGQMIEARKRMVSP